MAESTRLDPGAEPQVILGSSSPRRAQLLRRLAIPFRVHACEIDERTHVVGPVTEAARRVARAKYDAISSDLGPQCNVPVIAGDTLVSCRGAILGKPLDDDDALRMLGAMSAAKLRIVTAVCVGLPGNVPALTSVETSVDLRAITDPQIAAYIATGEATDKAGGLALQGGAAEFVERVSGCWSNVVGLPLCAVLALLDGVTDTAAVAARCSVALCGAHG